MLNPAVLTLALLITTSSTEELEPPSPEAVELVETVFSRTRYDAIVRATVDSALEALKKGFASSPSGPDDFSVFIEENRDVFQGVMPAYEEFRTALARHLTRSLPEGELRTTVRLARTPEGQRLMASLSLMTKELTELQAARVKAAIPVLMARAKARAERAQATGGAGLRRAAWRGDLVTVRALLDGGVAVDDQDTRGNTALLLAAEQHHVDVALLLVERGANVNAHTPKGFSVLMFAATGDSPELVRVLLAHGADVRAREGTLGMTALEMAERAHPEIAGILREAAAAR
jgi:hypothetical protein